jgi:hypothetical protein
MNDTRRTGGVPRWAWIGGSLLALLLAANLIIAFVKMPEGGDPEGFLTPDILLRFGFWMPVALFGGSALLGLFFVEKSKDRTDVRGVGWMRGAFLFGIVGLASLLIATWEQELFPRQEILVLCLWVYAIQMLLFARVAKSQVSRASTAGRRRRRRDDPEGGAATTEVADPSHPAS